MPVRSASTSPIAPQRLHGGGVDRPLIDHLGADANERARLLAPVRSRHAQVDGALDDRVRFGPAELRHERVEPLLGRVRKNRLERVERTIVALLLEPLRQLLVALRAA